MLGHFKKSASILTDQETQITGNGRWPTTICNTVGKIWGINVCSFIQIFTIAPYKWIFADLEQGKF